jgi:tetraacyldisaccharide 4'-kinase
MNPLTGLYGAGIALRNTLFDHGVLASARLQRPVVSVGNLSAGGTGKTPFVIALGELLKERGLRFDVLSRGYGRNTRGVRVVDPKGSASEFGDEPLLLARRLGVPVVVGESRYDAGRTAEQRFDAELHILDDGFQHRSLARDFDIVLIAPGDFRDRLLPSGRLREPFASLNRADALVLPQDVVSEKSVPAGKSIWRMTREISLSSVRPSPVVFCGLGRPDQFFAQVRSAGVTPAAEIVFRDHHAYDMDDVQKLLGTRRELGAGGFLTTEKDAINLGPLQAGLEHLAVATLKLTIDGSAELVNTILTRIADRKPRS